MKPLTVAGVRAIVAEIARVAKEDPEAAHMLEDLLRETVLEEVVRGTRLGKQLATEALKTRALDFPRWCA